MSSQRWNVVYRPRKFEKVIGQPHVISFFQKVLTRFFEQKKPLPIGVLFGGYSGSGKTTLARIVGCSLNCENRSGCEPCGKCESCKAIWRGEGAVWEIDASFFGLADNVRDLRDRLSSYSFSSYQVVILDECHMMSREAFNVLLKLLEDPPKNVMFILVTTEPDKVLETVRSRLLEFKFRALSWEQVSDYLQNLLTLEKVSCDVELVKKLYKASDYNFRDVLVTLEQLAIVGDGKITHGLVEEVCGDVFIFDELVNGLILGNYQVVLDRYERFIKYQTDPAVFINRLVSEISDRLRELLFAGRDVSVYLSILKSIYSFLSKRLPRGESSIKLLLFDILSSTKQDGRTDSVRLLSEDDVFNLLTKPTS